MINEVVSDIGTGRVLGFFGDKNFPNTAQGKGLKDKKEAIQRLQHLLLALKPKKVYVCPELGLSYSIMSLLCSMGIPYSVVNPYCGYFDNIPKQAKLRMFMGLENSAAVITIAEEKPETVVDARKTVEEAETFIIDNSEVLIAALGNNPNKHLIDTTEKLLASTTKKVIAISYAT
jgi:hypothetical protein